MQQEKWERLLQSDVDFDIKAAFVKAWEMYQSQALLHLAYIFLILGIQGFFVLYLPTYSILYSIILAPPLYTGYYLVANRISTGLPVTYGDFFAGFGYWFLSGSIWLIAQIIVFFGLLALLIPGIYLAVGYLFAVLIGIFGGFDFWTSMEMSRKLITRNWWKFFALFMIFVAMNALGLLMMGLGLIVTLPMTFLVTYVIFEDLTRDIFADEVDEPLTPESES